MRRLILAGAGHAHAQVLLQMAREHPHGLPDGVEVVVLSPYKLAPYSGMVPGWLSGRYCFDQIAIDFERLSRAAGATWLASELAGLNPDARTIDLTDGSTLAYDTLSLNIGSNLQPPDSDMLTLRPLANLKQRFESLLATWADNPGQRPRSLTVVGGGAAGFEVLLALQARLRIVAQQSKKTMGRTEASITARLITRGQSVLPEHGTMTRLLANRCLARNAVQCQTNTAWSNHLRREDDLVVWATGAAAHSWQRDPDRRRSLAVNKDGYIRIDSQLRSISHPDIFAAGDCAHWEGAPDQFTKRGCGLPKAGVYAVRMGPILTHNLLTLLNQPYGHRGTGMSLSDSLQSYRPQKHFLTILNTADGRAIAARGPVAAAGHWAMCWKDRIDTAFVERMNSPSAKPPGRL
ncbi:FAD-dependent oxidoreductase [Orrella marina]|uniref:FAD/NAD(P)-binding domain-containing protein n=1 Tax=Orrella marina TaxID=2163011 RepID=A0A2R4XHV0_9BURK|nr:FAD-dependent oxidoreductase [Orrella marina]AWB33402.1 hypothetical protein DBV39_06440 [Orrella marina]